MKNGGILRKIVSFVVSSILICNIPVFASNVQSNANRQENRLVSTIGQTDDVVATTYEAATTNAKLNSLNGSFHTIQKNVDYLINNCFSKLTVWIDSTNSTYASKTVILLKGSTTVGSCTMKANGTHYEAVFEKLPDGTYIVKYPYILSNGTVQSITTSITIQGKDVSKRLYGDLFQMSIPEIQQACKDGAITSITKVGDTFSDGTYTYTIIGINQDKPSDESGKLLPENSYGDVLTVMPLGAPKGSTNGQPVSMNASATPWGMNYTAMNSNGSNYGSWASSQMRNTTMPQYLEKLPYATRNVIGYVQKVTGNRGSSSISTTGDKCFLLSGKEIFGGNGAGNGSLCTTNEADATIQYQYFQNIATSGESRSINNTAYDWGRWWLRSPNGYDDSSFCDVSNGYSSAYPTESGSGVFAAFCIY